MSEKNQERKEIIDKLKLLKSIYGETARKQVANENDEDELIRICYEDAKTPSFQSHLGRVLFEEIIKYEMKYYNRPEIEYLPS